MIDLSIIIPIYNAAAYLRDCVASLYGQDWPEDQFEVLLVDDGSTDESCALVDRMALAHPNIRAIHQPNQGVAVARNHGIRQAKGRWLMMLDADDLWVPHTVDILLRTARQTEADIVRGDLIKLRTEAVEGWMKAHADGRPNEAEVAEEVMNAVVMNGEEAYRKIYRPYEGYTFRYLFRREFVERYQLHFIPGVKMIEDVEFVERALLRARRVVAMPVSFYLYRQHDKSCMYTMNESKLCDMNTVLGVIALDHHWPGLLPETLRCQARNFYKHLSVVTWYLTHHRSLYDCRKRVMQDFHQKVRVVPPGLTLKEQFTLWCLRHCPMTYLRLRYALPTRKFD